MAATFTMSRADNLVRGQVNHKLRLEGMPFLFAAVELLLTLLGSLNRRLGNIHNNSVRNQTEAERLFSGQAKATRADEDDFDLVYSATDCGFRNAPVLGDVKIRAILTRLFAGQRELGLRG